MNRLNMLICFDRLSYLFTTIVAWSNLIRGVTAVAAGYPYVFAERPRKVNICQALAYLS